MSLSLHVAVVSFLGLHDLQLCLAKFDLLIVLSHVLHFFFFISLK